MTENGQKPVILAVDDTPENLDVVRGILASGYTVKAAINGQMALKIVEKSAPDLILLDIMMPGMSGYEVCEHLKANPATRDIPVIFLTAMEQTTDETRGFELGAADYITKPVNASILEARVKTHLALKQSMDQLQAAYAVIKQQKDRMQEELNVGHTIQMSMLPQVFPAFPEHTEFDLHALLKPAREVGGDFYDYFLVDEDKLCLVVGDVSGKGVPAALFMAVTQTMIKTAAHGDHSPASIVTRVNNALSLDNPTCMFVTLFLAIVDFRTGSLTYCNAGHNPPYISRSGNELVCLRQRHGVVMGAMDGLAYGESTETLGNGDALFIFTDGITEAMDTSGQLFGEERLEQLLNQCERTAAADLTHVSLAAVENFAQGAEQSDDITVLAYYTRRGGDAGERKVLDLTIDADIQRMADALQEVQAFVERTGLPSAVGQRLGIILDELLNNSISYGFEDPTGHEIDLHIHADKHHLTLKVSDDGVPFNPFTLSDPDVTLSIEERKIGGLGVMLVREMSDSHDYERQSGRNIITLGINLQNHSKPKENST
jgi:sigma-B regulation protein RsbU (phosphoserine phosphatase)